jgi:hypothetical protein
VSPDLETKPRLRNGLVLGFAYQVGLAAASGWPNDVTVINTPNAYASTGAMFGRGPSFYLMGALSDYVNFGFWFAYATFEDSDWRSTGAGGGIRAEAFPLVSLVPSLGNLGLSAQFGIGGTALTSKNPGVRDTDGTQSFTGVGVFHDFHIARVLGGPFAIGPNLEYDAVWSASMERHGALLGARVVWYGGP